MAHKMSYLCNIFIFGRRSKYRFDQLFLKHPRFNFFDTKKGVEQSSCPLKPQFSMRKGSFLKKIAILEGNFHFLWFQQTHMVIFEIKWVKFNKLER